ncbi:MULTISPECIES: grasp-with-spasm system SPASM domain peptide maturase [Sphingobacterium]|uniref:grasp-with-spasm system SPASM domain peptide maturase n=1 Tax=Sphingobacterium TaxID=28453 RepID=UPI0024A6ADAC|nr:grasp-with-spasm system SPASM domain peptide maturase [Sphingobacterium thalpophilum]
MFNSNLDQKYFVLFACCVPVKGARRSILCDLQRGTFTKIPNGLYLILEKYKKKTIGWMKENFEDEDIEIITEYFDFLVEHEYGFFADSYNEFPPIALDSYYDSKLISNAIVDFDENSKHDFINIIKQLSDFFCEGLEVRLYSKKSKDFIENIILATEYSTLRSLQLLIKYAEEISEEYLMEIQKKYPRVKLITVHSANENKIVENSDSVIYFTTETILSEACCGQISPFYFSINLKSFIDSKHRNSCLSQKISIDKNGAIKNCPSMSISFGNIENTLLKDVIKKNEFTSIWALKKDNIESCSDCEYRYICQDCRAYTLDNSNPYSKPAKCSYDPYGN